MLFLQGTRKKQTVLSPDTILIENKLLIKNYRDRDYIESVIFNPFMTEAVII